MAFTTGSQNLRSRLIQLAGTGQTINEVYVLATQVPGEPTLIGVTVVEVEGDFVTFNQTGSGGVGNIIVLIDKIVAIDVMC